MLQFDFFGVALVPFVKAFHRDDATAAGGVRVIDVDVNVEVLVYHHGGLEVDARETKLDGVEP